MPKQIQIFKVGSHSKELTADQLAKTADAYNTNKHEAPLTFGHPEHDAPAMGLVESLQFDDKEGVLSATVKNVQPELEQAVKAGLFKKISAAFYHPDSNVNPIEDIFSLHHVGFLGAQPPAVKGMGAVAFSEYETARAPGSDIDQIEISYAGSLYAITQDYLAAKVPVELMEEAQAVPGINFSTAYVRQC